MNEIIYENCILTHSNAKVREEYIVYSEDKYHAGIDLYGKNIYSPHIGVVIEDCLVDDKFSLVIQYSENVSLRYTNLSEILVHKGQLIEYDQHIAKCESWFHFEYLTSEYNSPSLRCFFSGFSLYKHDPKLVLDKNVLFDNSPALLEEDIDIFGDTLEELSNNKG